jgi:hypothetical protein
MNDRSLHVGTQRALCRRLPGLVNLLLAIAALAAWTAPAFARGDKVIPQVVDGAGRFRTKIDIHNLSPTTTISRVKLYFYRADGAGRITKWNLATNLGTSDEFLLDLGKSQTLRVETLGLSSTLVSGYAVIKDGEGNSIGASDYRLGISVYYEVLEGSQIVDTVSVPVGQPCLRWVFPVETNHAAEVYSGIAIVNLSDETNHVTLRRWTAFQPSTAHASDGGTVVLELKPRGHYARFLHQSGLFPSAQSYRAALEGTAEKPVVVLGLLQSQSALGVQYATLAAEYTDALYSESTAFLPQNASVDADTGHVPYVTLEDTDADDLWYRLVSSTVRWLVPSNGAAISVLGPRTLTELNNLTLQDLQTLPYSSDPVDVSDYLGVLLPGYSVAVRTSQGRYAKLRVDRVIATPSAKDLAVQVYVYK